VHSLDAPACRVVVKLRLQTVSDSRRVGHGDTACDSGGGGGFVDTAVRALFLLGAPSFVSSDCVILERAVLMV
jgi:hypothetical protein